MTQLPFLPKSSTKRRPRRSLGMGTAEAIVSLAAGTLVIGAGAMALRTTDVLINRSEGKASLRQNTTNGLRLLRSEVERSMHIIVDGSAESKGKDFDINNEDYASSLSTCQTIASNSGVPFSPVFGLKMVELSDPVFYGISTSSNGSSFSLSRCGAPLSMDGAYNETQETYIARVIDDIASMPCALKEDGTEECTNAEKANQKEALSDIAANLNVKFSTDTYQTPERIYREPAFKVETDPNYKLVKLIDPNSNEEYNDNLNESYLKLTNAIGSDSVYPLYLAAFARADKEIENYGESGFVIDSAFFPELSSDRVAFLVDGSGSMSACILWGSGYGERRTYWDGRSYRRTRRSCAITRMESLQRELMAVLTDLHHHAPGTKITLSAFSSPGYSNHRDWSLSSDKLVDIGNEDNYESAIGFVQSLDSGDVRRWGGTDPWNGLEKAMTMADVNAVYFLSDGEPNKDRRGGRWSQWDYRPTVDHYVNKNNERSTPAKIFTTALGLESPWMRMFATDGEGVYTQIDPESLKDNNGHGNNEGFCDPSNPSANFDHCNNTKDVELTGAGQFKNP